MFVCEKEKKSEQGGEGERGVGVREKMVDESGRTQTFGLHNCSAHSLQGMSSLLLTNNINYSNFHTGNVLHA